MTIQIESFYDDRTSTLSYVVFDAGSRDAVVIDPVLDYDPAASAFAVLTVLSSVEFSIAAGFGLFAILALFSLRSEQISKIEISYFFGSIAIAVICSVLGTDLVFVCLIVTFVLIGAWILDHPRILQTASGAKLTLDRIDAHVLSDPEQTRVELSKRLGVEVMTFQVIELNYVNDLARINVFYRK